MAAIQTCLLELREGLGGWNGGQDFSDDPEVRNPPADAGDGYRFNPGSGKIPHASGQLSQCPRTYHSLCALEPLLQKKRSRHNGRRKASRESQCTATKTQRSQNNTSIFLKKENSFKKKKKAFVPRNPIQSCLVSVVEGNSWKDCWGITMTAQSPFQAWLFVWGIEILFGDGF